jgi:hypothetical protein
MILDAVEPFWSSILKRCRLQPLAFVGLSHQSVQQILQLLRGHCAIAFMPFVRYRFKIHGLTFPTNSCDEDLAALRSGTNTYGSDWVLKGIEPGASLDHAQSKKSHPQVAL